VTSCGVTEFLHTGSVGGTFGGVCSERTIYSTVDQPSKSVKRAIIECSHGGDRKTKIFSGPRSRKALNEKRKSRRRGNATRTGNASRDYQNYNSTVS
jgi:hypothetical protein